MDDTRIQRRTRVRPYDLRRKVLLKNFLQYQMTHVSPSCSESFPKCEGSNEESSSSDEESSSCEIDDQVPSSAIDDVHDISNSSNEKKKSIKNNFEIDINLTEEIDVVTVDNHDIAVNSNCSYSHSPSLVKFTGLFKRDSKTTSKSNFKSKKLCKNSKSSMKTRSFKKGFERVFYGNKKSREKLSSSQMSKNSSRSLFSLFKHRREQRHAKESDRVTRSSDNHISKNVPTKSGTISQSVQTDDSWVKEEINKVHQSNKRLKEENKLLSESLSYFMSNASIDPQLQQYSSPFQSSNTNYENSLRFHDYSIPPASSNQKNWNARSKVSRSKSAHEFDDRQKMLRNNYRTKSMSVHNSRNYFLTNSRPLLSTYNDVANISRFRKKNNMPNRPNNTSSRNIQRRSSMPERTFSENDRFASYGRSNSMRNYHTRKPFYALSADAFY